MPDNLDRRSLSYSEQDMAREAMKRLGDWVTTELDLAVGLDVFPEDFQTPADCGLAEMRGICLECSTTFMASISSHILSCGNTCRDVAEVTYNNSAKALFRSAIEAMITTRYILDGSNEKEKIGRVLREECNNLRGALRMQERNTLDQWGDRSIAETRSIVLQIENHHSIHFHSVIKNAMKTEPKFTSVVERFRGRQTPVRLASYAGSHLRMRRCTLLPPQGAAGAP